MKEGSVQQKGKDVSFPGITAQDFYDDLEDVSPQKTSDIRYAKINDIHLQIQKSEGIIDVDAFVEKRSS